MTSTIPAIDSSRFGSLSTDRYFVVFAAQHFGQVAAHFADSGDYDFHIPFVLFFVFESKYPFQQFLRQFELRVEPSPAA